MTYVEIWTFGKRRSTTKSIRSNWRLDIGVTPIALYYLWQHRILASVLVGLVPPILVSLGLLKWTPDLEKLKWSNVGRYVGRYMTPAIEAIRLLTRNRTISKCGGVVRLVRTPVTQEAAGSSPVAPAILTGHSRDISESLAERS